MCTNICFSRRTELAWHFPAPTLANNAGTAFLTNTWGKGSRTGGSKLRHTHNSLPGSGLLLHSLFSALSGHICCHTGWHLDFRSTHGSVTGLKDMFRNLNPSSPVFMLCIFWKRFQTSSDVRHLPELRNVSVDRALWNNPLKKLVRTRN